MAIILPPPRRTLMHCLNYAAQIYSDNVRSFRSLCKACLGSAPDMGQSADRSAQLQVPQAPSAICTVESIADGVAVYPATSAGSSLRICCGNSIPFAARETGAARRSHSSATAVATCRRRGFGRRRNSTFNSSLARPKNISRRRRFRAQAENDPKTFAMKPIPQGAVRRRGCFYTDVWVSMGKEEESRERLAELSGWQIDAALLEPRQTVMLLVLHCTCRRIAGKEISRGCVLKPRGRDFPAGREPFACPEGDLLARNCVATVKKDVGRRERQRQLGEFSQSQRIFALFRRFRFAAKSELFTLAPSRAGPPLEGRARASLSSS